MKLLPIVILKGCSYVEVPLCRLHVSDVFGGRAGFNMDASHVFSQGVLTGITLKGDGAGDRGTRAGAQCEAELSLRSLAITTLPWVQSYFKLLEQKH